MGWRFILENMKMWYNKLKITIGGLEVAVGYSVLKEKVKTARKLGFMKIVGACRWEQRVAVGGNRFASISLTNKDIASIDDLEGLHGALVKEVKENFEKYNYKHLY